MESNWTSGCSDHNKKFYKTAAFFITIISYFGSTSPGLSTTTTKSLKPTVMGITPN